MSIEIVRCGSQCLRRLFGGFSLGLFVWQAVLFIALVLLLKKFAWKPILDAVNSREEGIKDALEAAEKARIEMENLHADNERILKEARIERETMLKDARDIKAKMINDAKEEAQSQKTPTQRFIDKFAGI